MTKRDDGTWETGRRKGLYRRLTLRRSDGRVYLDRWALVHDGIGGVMLHRMTAPDPGIDLHDHPWTFVTIPLWGGYTELRADTPSASAWAIDADADAGPRGIRTRLRPFRPKVMHLDECHTITELHAPTVWTLVLRGRRVRRWGFYLAGGWMSEAEYDATVRAERRDLWSDQNAGRPW